MLAFKQLREETRNNEYAIGMAVAKKKAGYGKGPVTDLPKAVITKGHEIAKKIRANESFDEILDEMDQLDELSKKTLASYLHKNVANDNVSNQHPSHDQGLVNRAKEHNDAVQGGYDKEDKKYTKDMLNKRHAGVTKAIKKLSGGKKSSASSYLKATLNKTKPNTHLDLSGQTSGTVAKGDKDREVQRTAGVHRAINKLAK